MAKQLNGIFRTWMKVRQPDPNDPPVIWGKCIVHLSNPEFSGNTLHTSGIVDIAEHKSIKIVETRNNLYALLGPELVMPADCDLDPADFLERHDHAPPAVDMCASAAMTAEPGCLKCHGTGVYRLDERWLALCDLCCKHNRGWWRLEGDYGVDTGRWACKAGCGLIVDEPPLEMAFLPRTIDRRDQRSASSAY